MKMEALSGKISKGWTIRKLHLRQNSTKSELNLHIILKKAVEL